MKYDGSYRFLAQHLSKNGYSVYPHEMICGFVECPHDQNRFVDVVAMKDGFLYAFEYKSAGDYLLRALKQVENYRLSFDFVIVVAEIPRTDVSVNPKTGVRIHEILDLGAGLWTVMFHRKKAKRIERQKLAEIMKSISEDAPIESHEVRTDSKGKLTRNRDMWFWLFYSAMDRRSDASKFIYAKQALDKERLFHPFSIMSFLSEVGKKKAVNKVGEILRKSGFPLLKDSIVGDLSHPRSIVESSQFMSRFNFSFESLYSHYVDSNKNLVEARDALWRDLKNQIYGVGPRTASQFIRGMVLKGSWDFPLDDDRFLELCDFNVKVAENIGLIESKLKYREELGRFADNYLDGNRGVISHVLWYIRKAYCNSNCFVCPFYSNCYLHPHHKTDFNIVTEPKLQTPNPKNREWVLLKFHRHGSKLPILKNQPTPDQKRLDGFINLTHSTNEKVSASR